MKNLKILRVLAILIASIIVIKWDLKEILFG
jgi:hypothetical protein